MPIEQRENAHDSKAAGERLAVV